MKRHRLLELFLIEILKYNWEEVHQEAEILEHRISDFYLLKGWIACKFPRNLPARRCDS
ncbi:iron dependent repressor, metal binding and dimerization domain protein [Staphylococcus aureus]